MTESRTVVRCPRGHTNRPGANFCDTCGEGVRGQTIGRFDAIAEEARRETLEDLTRQSQQAREDRERDEANQRLAERTFRPPGP